MSRRLLIFLAAFAAVTTVSAGAAVAARAASPDAQMRDAVMALRGLVDREGAAASFVYPEPNAVRPGGIGEGWWPTDPWGGGPLLPGSGRGRYRYTVSADRRHYRLVGWLSRGAVTVRGGIPLLMVLAFDHRSEEGLNLIRQYVEDWARTHGGMYPLTADVSEQGAVGRQGGHVYWPSNPWTHLYMAPGTAEGSYSYELGPGRSSYTLRLHRALKHDYVLTGPLSTDPWQQLLVSLDDEILRRGARILAGYVGQWALAHDGALPTRAELAPGGAVADAHADWPTDPLSGLPMRPGAGAGAYLYAPSPDGSFRLAVHLHTGVYGAGGVAPPPAGR